MGIIFSAVHMKANREILNVFLWDQEKNVQYYWLISTESLTWPMLLGNFWHRRGYKGKDYTVIFPDNILLSIENYQQSQIIIIRKLNDSFDTSTVFTN